MLALDKYKAS